jgi:hypothetical protein
MTDRKHEPKKDVPIKTGAKEAKLDALREAYPEELEVQGDKLRGDARREGASPEEAERAANRKPAPPRHG